MCTCPRICAIGPTYAAIKDHHLSHSMHDPRNNRTAATFSYPAWCWISTHLSPKTYSKQERVFFALGNLGAFQGKLNPLSSSSIFVICILPILIYRCETWLLNSSIITKLEQFQNEIGPRILQLPKHFSGKTVRLALQWPSMSTRVLIHKLKFLSRALSDSNDVKLISREAFSSLATINLYGVSIIQQCRMLESSFCTNVLARCLKKPGEASSIAAEQKSNLIIQATLITLMLSPKCQASHRSCTNYILVSAMGDCSR